VLQRYANTKARRLTTRKLLHTASDRILEIVKTPVHEVLYSVDWTTQLRSGDCEGTSLQDTNEKKAC